VSLLKHPAAALLLLWSALNVSSLFAQLNENCTVSVLNRNVRVQPDGTWVLPNIPANQGRVRARAVCVQNGVTQQGQSNLFTISTNGSIDVIPPITFGTVTPIPQALTITAPTTNLNQNAPTTQLTAQANYSDGTSADITPASAGTDYTSSNPSVATVSPDGLVTGIRSGTSLITAFNEGTSGTISIRVGIAPTVTITSPTSGSTVTGGATIPVTASASGPAIAFVKFVANSQTVFTSNIAPYQFAYTVPPGATSVTFSAQADDGFGNIGTSSPVVITVARDPGTTVTGRALDSSLNPVSGATATVFNQFSGTTGTDGRFSISGVPTAEGDVAVVVTATIGGRPATAISRPASPVPAGTTNVGDVVFPVASPSRWTQLQPTGTLPAARDAAAGGYDPVTDRLIVFGGNIPGINLNDVWILANATGTLGSPQWINLLSNGASGSPSARAGQRAVYDSKTNRLIVFGGCTGLCLPVSNEVWVLANANGLGGTPSWTRLTPSGIAPAARTRSAVVYDSVNNRMIIFAGQDGSGSGGATFSDVWVLTNANGVGIPAWIQLSPSGGPPPGQYGATAVYDPSSNRMTVFAGGAQGTGVATNAVWTLTNANGLGGPPSWINLIPEGSVGSPSKRGFGAGAYDPTKNQMTVFGGQDSTGLLNDTWVLLNANGQGGTAAWVQRNASGSLPAPRNDHTGALDPVTKRLIIFGGFTFNGVLNDAWVFDEVQDASGTPPAVQITAPDAGTAIIQGSRVTVQVTATDDVAVAAVSFFLNGQSVFTTRTSPYQYTFTAPTTGSTVTLGATATDIGGEVGRAMDVTVNLIPDPLTTVTGRVLDSTFQPVTGAIATALGHSSLATAPDGKFTIAGVPTVGGKVSVFATAIVAGQSLIGASNTVSIVIGGTTDVGDIVLSKATPALLVASSDTNSILRYDATIGIPVDAFVPAGSGGLQSPSGIAFGPDGNLYVSSQTGAILRYNGLTGAFIDAFVPVGSGGLKVPAFIVFGLDGNLYVSDFADHNIKQYNGITGASMGIFASGGGIANPQGLLFGPDGNLYVADEVSVLRYSGATGAFLGVFVAGGTGGLNKPVGLAFGPDGNLYVGGSLSHNILRYNGTTGVFIGAFVPSSTGGLDRPHGIAFGPDGNLYVADEGSQVLRFDGGTGTFDAFVGTFVPTGSAGLSGATVLAFHPFVGLRGFSFCAYENFSCAFNGTMDVAFGAQGRFYLRTSTGGVSCDLFVFGDPIPGTYKACYTRPRN
jgi:streptogramin lyase